MLFVLDTILIEFLNDIEHKKNEKINSFVEHFEKNIENREE